MNAFKNRLCNDVTINDSHFIHHLIRFDIRPRDKVLSRLERFLRQHTDGFMFTHLSQHLRVSGEGSIRRVLHHKRHRVILLSLRQQGFTSQA